MSHSYGMILNHGIITFLYQIKRRHEIDPVRYTITSYSQHFGYIGMFSSQRDVDEDLQKFVVGSVPQFESNDMFNT